MIVSCILTIVHQEVQKIGKFVVGAKIHLHLQMMDYHVTVPQVNILDLINVTAILLVAKRTPPQETFVQSVILDITKLMRRLA
jgi:hypothetical protein